MKAVEISPEVGEFLTFLADAMQLLGRIEKEVGKWL